MKPSESFLRQLNNSLDPGSHEAQARRAGMEALHDLRTRFPVFDWTVQANEPGTTTHVFWSTMHADGMKDALLRLSNAMLDDIDGGET